MKALLLDFDGLLCDSLQIYFDLYQQACLRHGKTLPISSPQEFRDWYNPRWEQNYYDMGFSEEQFADVQQWSCDYLDYSRARLFDGVVDSIPLWAQKARLAVVSTTPSDLIRRRLSQESGLLEHFALITGGDDGNSEKREKVRATLEKLGCTSGVMCGDTPLDVDAGRFNQLETVGVTYGWISPPQMIAAAPTRLIDRPEELRQAVLDCLEMPG